MTVNPRGATTHEAHAQGTAIGVNPVVCFWVLAACVLIASVWLSLPWFMDKQAPRLVSGIDVEGAFVYQSEEELMAHLQPFLGSEFMSVELDVLKHQVQALPWVKRATLSRVWPSSLLVSYQEETPVAIWGDLNVLNDAGELLHTTPIAGMENLPRLSADYELNADDRLELLAQFQDMKALLSPYGLVPKELLFSARGALDLIVNDEVRVKLGRLPFESQLERLGRIYQSDLADVYNEIIQIDLRYPNGVSVKWKPETLALHKPALSKKLKER